MNNYLKILMILCVFFSVNIQAEWVLVDSTSFHKLLPADEIIYILVQSNTNLLFVTSPSDNLTDDAVTAVDIAPNWLKKDLQDNFRRLGNGVQNTYANLIINAEEPYLDEICFEVAHIAPETLSGSMNSQILLENVESLYETDTFLDYVNIIDHNDGDDYYSTTVYSILEEGEVQEIELPRDIYYWYIVHPKLHKEIPGYIDPNTGNNADPPIGVFWRDFLINHSDAGYSPLSTYLDTCNVLWKGEQSTIDNGAVGALTRWVLDAMTFQSNPHHDQPVRIYHQHIGTCSVHSYLTSAAARAALIPAVVNVMYSDNHKINEFYDRRWIAWEPVGTHIDSPETYENWGWNVASAFNWRGDGYIWDTTETYTEVCTLNVNVTDSNGQPVDGARIKINSEPCVSWGATAGWTDANGDKRFLLGDSRTYTARVESSIGNYPGTGMETVIVNSGAGFFYNWNISLPGTIPFLDVSAATPPGEPADDYRLVIEYDLPSEILYGENLDNDNYFSKSYTPGQIDFFICDLDNFNLYISEQSFEAFEIHQYSSGNMIDFTLPTSESFFAVFSNENKIVMTEEINAIVKLYHNFPSDIPDNEIKKLYPRLALYPNYPNPFNPETNITFYLSQAGNTELDIYDVKGRKVKTLINRFQSAGEHSMIWNSRDDSGGSVSSGIYFFRLKSGNSVQIRKAILMK